MRDDAFNSLAVCLNHESDGADFVPLQRSARSLFNERGAHIQLCVELPQACHSRVNLAAKLWPYKVGAPAESIGATGPSPRHKLQEIEARCREVPWSSVPFPHCAAAGPRLASRRDVPVTIPSDVRDVALKGGKFDYDREVEGLKALDRYTLRITLTEPTPNFLYYLTYCNLTCAVAREVMTGEHTVGRVIARPFEGSPGAFQRREGRRDYAAPPPGRSYLEELQDAGVPVHGVGKIRDLFAGVGIDAKHDGATNAKGIAATTSLIRELEAGLIFVNLVETDQVYGHRHDVEGFHRALQEIDGAVASWLRLLREDDLLVLTADHGVDPNAPHTDHTREYAPLLARFEGDGGRRHDGPLADVGASVLRWLTGRDAPALPGTPFV
jgi:hypothetical protein